MKNLIVFIIFFLLVVFKTQAESFEWSNEDTVRQLYFTYVLANDWKQTRDISKESWRREQNPILGKKPSLEKVNNYFLGCAVGHFLISYHLPEDYRKIWQLTWIGIQSYQIDENNLSGLQQEMGMVYKFSYTIHF